MPRRNGYCNRIHAIDELLPCQSYFGPGAMPGLDLGSGRNVEAVRTESSGRVEHGDPPGSVVPVGECGRIPSRGLIETEPRFGEVFGKEEPPRRVFVVAERPHVVGAERFEADEQHVGLEPRHEVRLDLGRRIEGANGPAPLRLRRRHQHARISGGPTPP